MSESKDATSEPSTSEEELGPVKKEGSETGPTQPAEILPTPAVTSVWSSLRSKLLSFNIGHLLLLLLGLHLFAMSFPSGQTEKVFDEAYYVTASKDLLNLIPNNLEHPFFGKVFGAVGIYLFGDNFFGWRIFYVIIGVLSVYLLYELARMFFSKEKALFAASLLGFETLFFIHTSLLLLEGPPIFFALLGFVLYFKKHYYLTAAALALSILSKEWGIYFVAALLLYHVWATKRIPLKTLFNKTGLRRIVVFLVILVLVVTLPLWAYDYVYHPYTGTTAVITPEVVVVNGTTTSTTVTTYQYNYVTNPIQNFEYYYSYHSSLTGCGGTNSWNCYPWSWILPFNIAPSGYYVTTVKIQTTSSNGTVLSTTYLHPIDWQGIGNLVIWYGIWIIVPVLIAKILTKKVSGLDALIGCWLAATYLPSLYISLVIHRVEYAFYFLNVDPALALGIPMVVGYIAPDSLKLQRLLMVIWLAAAIVFFVLFFPIHPMDFR